LKMAFEWKNKDRKQRKEEQMVQIELTCTEIDFLHEILQKSFSELSLEIAFTDRKDFRELLKKRKEFMEGFIQRLKRELVLEGTREQK
jgi:hypothetical protein